jgi:hypothetical protein
MAYTTNVQGTPQRGLLLSPGQIANLPAQQQTAYMNSLSPAEKALVAQEIANKKQADNRAFLRRAIEKVAYCPASGGSGNTQVYSVGTTLVYDFPVVGGGYAKALLIRFTLNLTFAAGTGAAYLLNAASPFNIFNEIDVIYNGQQIRIHPYLLKVLDQVAGYAKYPQQNGVVQGLQQNTTINSFEGVAPNTGTTTGNYFKGSTAVGAQTWTGAFLLPLNTIASDTVPGLLPIMGVGNKPQIKLVCTSGLLGNDPLINPVYASAGSAGWAVTAANTSTVSVDVIYQDGTTMNDPNGVALDLTTEPTLQMYWDTPLNPLSANLLMRQHISTLLEHVYVVSVVIDGQTAGQFSTINNITQMQLSADSVGQQNFLQYNIANNIPTGDYYDRMIRRIHGQDLDQGVILWVDAPCRGTRDSDDRAGVQTLNMEPGGYPATTHAYQVTAVGGLAPTDGGAKATPRVETFLISLNKNGLRLS